MRSLIRKIFPFWISIFLFSCAGPTNLEELRLEGEAEVTKLVKELRALETPEDLQRAIPRLRKRFNQIADLVLSLRKLGTQEPYSSAVSEELFAELARLYEMPSGREKIEMAQAQAVQILSINPASK